jgi:Pvc16 N-terminal domain
MVLFILHCSLLTGNRVRMSIETSSLIFSVSNTIRKTLSNFLKIREEDIIFDSPADLDSIPDSGLTIFLYRIMENPHLKNQDLTPELFTNPVKLRGPPLALDLNYLIIPFGNSENRLILIEKVMQLFHDFPIFESSLLNEDLINSGNKEIKIYLNEFSMDEVNKIWTLFPNKPFRLSLSYIVSPLLIPSSRFEKESYSRVISKQTHIGRKSVRRGIK